MPPPPPPPPLSLKQAVLLASAFTLLLWLIHLIDAFLLPAEIKPGVYPRRPAGLIGIFLAPLVHGSFEHLISNTLSLLLLGAGMIYLYPKSAKAALPALYLAPGIGVWLLARDAYHIGASGLSYGMMFFLLVAGMLRKDRSSVGISMAVLFLYSGMLLGLLPEDSDISFEYHLFGALAGVACAFALRHRDPPPAVVKYDWEDEEEDAEDPVIGEQWRQESPPHEHKGEDWYLHYEDADFDEPVFEPESEPESDKENEEPFKEKPLDDTPRG